MKIKDILKVKVSAYSYETNVLNILKNLNEQEVQEVFELILEELIQIGKIKVKK